VQNSRTQKKIITIQGILQEKIKDITGKETKVIGAARTDRGVHAIKQVAAFETAARLDADTLKHAINANLPCDIRVIDASDCPMDFHPRYSARSKTYFYIIAKSHSVFLKRYSWYVPYDLDCDLMRQSAEYLLGAHDFSSFRASGCSAKNPIRTIVRIKVEELLAIEFMTFTLNTPIIKISIEANAFLRHMARNIVGTLVEAGKGRFSPSRVKEILELKDRRHSGPTAPPQGLFLEEIRY